MMMAQSLFMALKQQYPSLVIEVLAPQWSLPLLAVMPEVSEGIELPFQHGELNLKGRYQLAQQLKARQYDWAIVLPNSFKSALIPFWAGIPKRTGFKGELRYGLLNDRRELDKQQLPMTVMRFVALAYPPNHYPIEYSFPSINLSADQLKKILNQFRLDNTRPILTLCPGAEYGEAKRWPANYFATVAEQMLAKGWQVLLLGSQKDQEVCNTITAQVLHADLQSLAGQTSLLEALTLLALSTKVLSNDSGLMHMAAAVGTPVIALYGSTDPSFTPPLHPDAKIVSLGLDCSPCFKRTCPLGHMNCLNQLLPTHVLSYLL
ncbi:MAG: hypothetical protein RLZZ422_1789 [Pseudomonadota bacterium]|jgi:heptosyltransferase-2